jgi:diaminohydroxyphosphoribosylaminopyrimidine deaminase / 5-amino-6-(5-phosphoribosylamino)uracil reductase
LKNAGGESKGATLYVNLEPCTHYGKTPPCTEAIIKAGIKRVVYAMDDPNPLVRKNAAAGVLGAAGIEVISGVLAEEAIRINEVFVKNQKEKLPFVALKAGVSLNGKIAASKESKLEYLTCDASLKEAHKLRRMYDGILVGVNTVILDNPRLDVRYGLLTAGYKNPTKIVLDPQARVPLDARIFESDAYVIVVVSEDAEESRVIALSKQAKVCRVKKHQNSGFNWKDLLTIFYEDGIGSVLLEGGAGVYTSAIEQNVVDKMIFFVAPKAINSKGALSVFKGLETDNFLEAVKLKSMTIKTSGKDMLIKGYPISYT